MNFEIIESGSVIHNELNKQVHDEIVRLEQEISEITGLTEGDIETRRALSSKLHRLRLIHLKL